MDKGACWVALPTRDSLMGPCDRMKFICKFPLFHTIIACRVWELFPFYFNLIHLVFILSVSDQPLDLEMSALTAT
jgi:hypothetical protein